MKIRKILSAAITAVMLFVSLPAASLAENIGAFVKEAEGLNKMDRVWERLDAAEAEALADGLNRNEIINAVYNAALALDDVDSDSFDGFDADGFYFTVDGMYNAYNYRLRNEIGKNSEHSSGGRIVIENDSPKTKDAGARDVLLVGPYYDVDPFFDDTYKNEVQSIASVTGGNVVILATEAATGPAIVENYTDKAVVIYDSHGIQYGTSTYLCLTTNEGIGGMDYSMGWAVNTANGAYIDGRYVLNHLNGKKLANTFVWMAMCEGMNSAGNGTTGRALLEAGAGVVYGYSQEVSFVYEYECEETFWNEMKEGKTVAQAFNKMIEVNGWYDRYISSTKARPIIMSEDDEYPQNPDGDSQIVNCRWTLLGNINPVDFESYTFSEKEINLIVSDSTTIDFNPEPINASNYSLTWTSSNPWVASVTANNKYRATVTGLSAGSAVINCAITANGKVTNEEIKVNVVYDSTLSDALNVEGGSLNFSMDAQYGFSIKQEAGRKYVVSNNAGEKNSTAKLTSIVPMAAGDTLAFDFSYGTEKDCDWFIFTVDGKEVKKWSGEGDGWETYTYNAEEAAIHTFEWRYEKDKSRDNKPDCVMIDNVVYTSNGGPVPTATPTPVPTDTPVPTATPTPTLVPTATPTPVPTDTPTPVPTDTDTAEPTDTPTPVPTDTDTAEPTETPTVTAGDIDGDGSVTVTDALMSLRSAMGLISLSNAQISVGDIDGDGSITTVDAVTILRMAML